MGCLSEGSMDTLIIRLLDEPGGGYRVQLLVDSGSGTSEPELVAHEPLPEDLPELAEEASERFAAEENVEVGWERIWNIEPILFDEALIELADESIREVAGESHRLPSGPLHDAAEVARAGVPTVMLFVQSLRGLSHTKLENTKGEHLELSVQALDRLADKTIARVVAA